MSLLHLAASLFSLQMCFTNALPINPKWPPDITCVESTPSYNAEGVPCCRDKRHPNICVPSIEL